MRRILMPIVLFLLCLTNAGSQTQKTDSRLMTDAQYKVFLSQVGAVLPRLEAAFQNLKPENDPKISYSISQIITENRLVGLMQIDDIRTEIKEQKQKRTVSGEVTLNSFVQELYESMSSELAVESMDTNLPPSHFERFVPEMSSIGVRIGNDSIARVQLLESHTCP